MVPAHAVHRPTPIILAPTFESLEKLKSLLDQSEKCVQDTTCWQLHLACDGGCLSQHLL